MIKEYLLTTDDFKNPRVEEGTKAIGTLIMRLMLLAPGTIPTHPDMGIGIGPKYRYIMDSDLIDLQSRIQEQLETYFPLEYHPDNIELSITPSKYLNIKIVINDIVYIYETEKSNTPVQLSELIK